MPFKKGQIPWNKIPRPDPELFPLPPREEVLWAAGFFEGEGSVSKRSVTAVQVDPWPLLRLIQTFGGSLGNKPRDGDEKNKRPCYQWHVCGAQGRMFVALILPHLSPRRRAQIETKFITEDKRQRNRASLHLVRKELVDMRGRDENGRFDSAQISRTSIAS